MAEQGEGLTKDGGELGNKGRDGVEHGVQEGVNAGELGDVEAAAGETLDRGQDALQGGAEDAELVRQVRQDAGEVAAVGAGEEVICVKWC